jgi:hypothetical protein
MTVAHKINEMARGHCAHLWLREWLGTWDQRPLITIMLMRYAVKYNQIFTGHIFIPMITLLFYYRYGKEAKYHRALGGSHLE